ncbi:MAG TPA: substrate-binding domain-containing protein [Vicinamibacterales bacterium]|jgi:ribose transport system substrate-binding protein|nr:substrate-binding domain-containing protein [Vicinamibacterales bacterium]
MAPVRDPYLVKAVVHSSRVLSAFRSSGEALPLRDVSARSGLSKSMAFRLLYTLERCGLIEKIGENLYRSSVRPFKQKLYRIGYAAQGTDYQFSKEVSAGLQRAAAAEGVELICVDNRYNPKIAQRNADVLVREHVDLVIEFQTDEQIAPIVATKYREANIPLIAIEIPHPGATYFGANNYEAGLIGGRYLGRWTRQRWHGEVDEIVLVALKRAGSLPQMRLTGVLVGMKEVCSHLEDCRVTYLDGDGVLGDSFEAMRKHLRTSKSRHIVVGAINDPSALGALRAFQEAGRADSCAIVGHNASPEGRAELRQPGTRLIGSVAYFPEKYGDEILKVALDILHRRPVPPAVFVKHQMVTPDNVNHVYPNDELMGISAAGLA